MSSTNLEGNHEGHELVAFRVADQEYCVNIRSVREIRGWSIATPLPHSPEYVCGVINLRGSVLPVVDLASRFGGEKTEPKARHVIIVAQIREQVVGLLVEAVLDILTVEASALQPTPDVASEKAKSFVSAMIAMDERMIRLLDLEAVVPQVSQRAA